MSCPAVIDVLVPSGPIVVDMVTPGPPGAIGSRWFTGASVPAADLGAVGDYYLRVNGDVYGPKASGWGAVQFTLTGSALLSDSTPQPLGTAAEGTAATASRSDHRHAMPTAAQVGADSAGTAAAAVAAHEAAADPHPLYITAGEVAAAAPVQSVAGRTGAVVLGVTDVSGLGTLATQSGTFSGTSSGVNTGDQTTISGNAGTATKLETPRTIGGSSFDGSANVTAFPSPGAIGGTTPAAGAFTTLSASDNLTLSGRFIQSLNGAASAPPMSMAGTWFTGGTSTTTKPQFLIEPAGTPSSHWSTSGTGLGINAPSGFGGDIFWTGVNGATAFRVNNANGIHLSIATFVGNSLLASSGRYSLSTTGLTFRNDAVLGSSASTYGSPPDTILRRDEANTWAQRNGAFAQKHRVYNTWTSDTDYERLNIRWTSNQAIIDTEAGSGGGTLRGLKIGSAATSLLSFYGATPVVQGAAIPNATDLASALTSLNSLLARARVEGRIAT